MDIMNSFPRALLRRAEHAFAGADLLPCAGGGDLHPAATDLEAARAILADVAHHTDETLAQACRTLLRLSPDHCDRTRAAELLELLA